MKILIVTDAWFPQVNGVVTTLSKTISCLEREYDDVVEVIHPGMFRTIPTIYPDVQFAFDIWNVWKKIDIAAPETIHIATEGPLGWAARRYCHANKLNYTTSYHTNFPEYIQEYTRGIIPAAAIYPLMRWMHNHSTRVLATTNSMKETLEQKGFKNIVVWSRGVDTELFSPDRRTQSPFWPDVLTLLYVGRISIEKNIKAFLDIDISHAEKVVVGDGPLRKKLEKQYPEVTFTGVLTGHALACQYASADVFVFPSKTDTYGVVMLEAMACGTPVAAYRAPGPIDVVINGVNGYISDNLKVSIYNAAQVKRESCRKFALDQTWSKVTKTLRDNLVKL